MLQNKNALILGAGGAIGSAVARRLTAEGAHVFLAGRTESVLESPSPPSLMRPGNAWMALTRPPSQPGSIGSLDRLEATMWCSTRLVRGRTTLTMPRRP